jgi:hypothetical protein
MALTISEVITQPQGGQRQVVQIAAIAHAAATATEDIALIAFGFACRLLEAYYVPTVAVTGADTNSTNLNVINRGTNGGGTTELGNKDYATGVNMTAKTPNAIVTGLTTAITDGTVIALNAEKVGTGLDIPAGTFVLVYDGGA